MTLRLPWQPLDPDGDGILARVVHDAGTEHVAVFESAGAARAACDAVNRAEGRESELREMTGELDTKHAQLVEVADKLRDERTAHAETREELRRARVFGNEQERRCRNLDAACEVRANKAEHELAETRAKLEEMACVHAARTGRELDLIEQRQRALVQACTPAERAVLDAMAECTESDLIMSFNGSIPTPECVKKSCRSELARRGKKP